MDKEIKYFGGSVKDVDSAGKRVTGYLASFDNLDFHNDIIEKGSFRKSLMERFEKIFFLNQHDWSQPHGNFEELSEDDYGLYFVSKPLVDTSYSQDAIKLYEAGILKEHSIGFNTIKDEYDSETGVRRIKEVKLYEGSNVTLGANPLTPFRGFKSEFTPEMLKQEHKKFLKAFRTGTFTDETFGLIELALIDIQEKAAAIAVEEYKESLRAAESTHEPMIDETKAILNYLKNK